MEDTKVTENIDRLGAVVIFNQTFKHPVNTIPTVPTMELIKNKIKYLEEELKELEEAVEKNDIVGVLDACLDIDYFNLGIVAAAGLQDKYQRGFNIVHNANMKKACYSEEERQATQDHYAGKGITTHWVELTAGVWAVVDSSNNKTLKSINWKEGDLKVLFE